MSVTGTKEADSCAGEVQDEDQDEDSSDRVESTSANMARFLTDRTREKRVERVGEVVVANTPNTVEQQLGVFDNRVPLSLLPYKKDQITIEHARKTYKYRHVLKRNDSTVGLVYNNESCVVAYRAELSTMFDEILLEGKCVYEKQIVHMAKAMGIKRWDGQDISNFSDLQQWSVHHSNHGNHRRQIEVLETLATMFFTMLDSIGRDYWLDSAVSAWTTRKKIVVDHDINSGSNIIFGRKRGSDGFVKSLFKRANLDYHISLLRRKLMDKYGITFCRKKNPKSSIMEYRPVNKDGHRYGWIGHSARNGQLWDNNEQFEKTEEASSKTSKGTSDFLKEVVEGLKKRQEFELAGEVQRWLGRIKHRMVVGMNVEKDEAESNTSPLTGGSVAKVRTVMRLKINTIMD
jgi:hypothetical protein